MTAGQSDDEAMMGGVQGLLSVLDTRAFGSVWYWLTFAGLWTWLGRGALGVPTDLVRAVRRDDRGTDADGDRHGTGLLLLDWVSLVVPRWRVARRDGAILVAAGSFALSSLAVLGFVFDRQFAQALALLLGPLMLLAVLRVRLAARLARTMQLAETGGLTPASAAAGAANAIMAHLRLTGWLSLAAVAGAAMWGTRWLALHPNGL